jgi:hypothetical protein
MGAPCAKLSVFLAAFTLCLEPTRAQDQAGDELTRQLFEQYVARRSKISTESILAATHLVAERGRRNGFWKSVLAELRRNDEQSEIGCVRVLGKMLETDAAARDAIRRTKTTGEISAWVPTVQLDHAVVKELLKRADQADRFRIDHYTIALARSRVPEAREFFRSILAAPVPINPFGEGPSGPIHLTSTRFHAAVGLAQLGDSEGLQWLIEHCDDTAGTVTNAWPKGARPGGGLGNCCTEALRQLSGQRGLTTRADWEAWLTATDETTLHNRAVIFGDPY